METQNSQTPLEGVKMVRTQVFELGTAPESAVVVIYKVEVDNSLPLQPFYVAAFNDGNIEVVWGSGTTPEDSLEVASREWDYLLEGSPVREANPFREALGEDQKSEEGE